MTHCGALKPGPSKKAIWHWQRFVMCVANRNFRCTQSPATVSSVSALVVPKSVFTAADTAVAMEGRCVTWGKRVVVMTYSYPQCVQLAQDTNTPLGMTNRLSHNYWDLLWLTIPARKPSIFETFGTMRQHSLLSTAARSCTVNSYKSPRWEFFFVLLFIYFFKSQGYMVDVFMLALSQSWRCPSTIVSR